MCELLGMSCNKEVGLDFSFKELEEHSEGNPDGWGFGFYEGRFAQVFREPKQAKISKLADFFKEPDFVKSKIIISHIRRWTQSSCKYKNCHPFERELFGRSWILAHNGSVVKDRIKNLPQERFFSPIGTTDTEVAFCYITNKLKEKLKSFDDQEKKVEIIKNCAKEIGPNFNFLLSDSEYLYAYRNGEYKNLYYLLRHPPHEGLVKLKDNQLELDLSVMKGGTEKAAIIATAKLTNETLLKKFEVNEFIVFKDGEVVEKEIIQND
ncbi:MAG: hypothetical protein GY861_09355 [bacterium]|nr:hypothetical protein [bacterium]